MTASTPPQQQNTGALPPPNIAERFDPTQYVDATGRLTEEGLRHAGTLMNIFGVEVHPIDLFAYQTLQEQRVVANRIAEQQGSNRAELRPDEFNDISVASKTMYVKESNRLESKFPGEELKYPIPTFEYMYDEAGPIEPIDNFERFVRWVGKTGYLTVEDFVNENQKRSGHNKRAVELLNELQSTGYDGQIRALFSREVHPGVWQSIHDREGKEQPLTPALVAEARKKWFRDPSAFQAAFWYEINKAASEKEFAEVMEMTIDLLNEASARRDGLTSLELEGQRFSDRDIIGVLAGVGFMHKPNHLTFKHAQFQAIVDPETGLRKWQYLGVNSPKFVQELSTKFEQYKTSGFSPVDAGNVAEIARIALDTSIRYRFNPELPEFKRSQFILQRLAGLVSDLRYTGTPDPGKDGEHIADPSNQRLQLGMRSPGKVKLVNGRIVFENMAPVRTGASPVATAYWEKVASYTDVACHLFPNLQFIIGEKDEISPVVRKADERFSKLFREFQVSVGTITKEWILKEFKIEHADDPTAQMVEFEDLSEDIVRDILESIAERQTIGVTKFKEKSGENTGAGRRRLRKDLKKTDRERKENSREIIKQRRSLKRGIESEAWRRGTTEHEIIIERIQHEKEQLAQNLGVEVDEIPAEEIVKIKQKYARLSF